MAYTFKPNYIFTKGIAYAEFFDIATDNLLGFSSYVSDFGLNGNMNSGDIEGGPGNQLIMCVPDTARLEVTAKTADAALNNIALGVGAELTANGVIEVSHPITAAGNQLTVQNAVAPPGSKNGAIAYILTSSGADKATVEQNSGTAYKVDAGGNIQGFSAITGQSYCVKYFVNNSSAQNLTIPALFQPKVVRAHFAVNCYAKMAGADAKASALYKIRHYYFPRYFFTAGLQDSVNQTTPGSVDLSGKCLTFDGAGAGDICAAENGQAYGFIVDEFVGGTSTAGIDGIYFIGLGDGISVAADATAELPVKYSVGGVLTDISDMSQVTFTAGATETAKFTNEHVGTVTGVAPGTTTVTVSVTNSENGHTYKDVVQVTVT